MMTAVEWCVTGYFCDGCTALHVCNWCVVCVCVLRVSSVQCVCVCVCIVCADADACVCVYAYWVSRFDCVINKARPQPKFKLKPPL